jgi:hypothetical protein
LEQLVQRRSTTLDVELTLEPGHQPFEAPTRRRQVLSLMGGVAAIASASRITSSSDCSTAAGKGGGGGGGGGLRCDGTAGPQIPRRYSDAPTPSPSGDCVRSLALPGWRFCPWQFRTALKTVLGCADALLGSLAPATAQRFADSIRYPLSTSAFGCQLRGLFPG